MYTWNESLRIGNAMVDDQHKQLFKIAEKVESLLNECRPHSPALNKDTERQQRVLRETIKYLKSYAINHFAAEEAYQRKVGYKGYDEHKKIHDDFAVAVERMEAKVYEENCSDECVNKFLEWFSAWLYNHIMYEDQRIVGNEN